MPTLLEFRNFNRINTKDYEQFDSKLRAKLISAAKKSKNKKVLHINATPFGGGVAEMLRSQIPFERMLGIKSHWLTIKAPIKFFRITKKIHNFIQGKSDTLTEKEKSLYISVNRELQKSLAYFIEKYKPTSIVIHDPQPLPLVNFIPKQIHKILRLHIDLSTPNPAILEFLKQFIVSYDKIVLSNKIYRLAMPWLKLSKIAVIMPAIDPLSVKNRSMNSETARLIINEFGINHTKPLITQVSRFDPWKDPLGVIKAYYLAKNKIPDIQLAMAGFFFAQDDPEAKEIFKIVKKNDRGDRDIFLFSNPKKLLGISNDTLINALYTASDLVIQKSIREGFGLTMTEAMWKGRAVVAGKTTGALVQIKDGKNGILVNSSEEAAEAIVRLMKNEKSREKLGKAAHQSVKRRFLLPHYVLNNIKLYN
ncbi:MAG: glycosyltransferase [Parcubacteria group bacterium]|nr:glycosyltransferase [Parcubacteria group bacterium]